MARSRSAGKFAREWTPEQDAVVKSLPPKDAARKLGVNLRRVYDRRHNIGAAKSTTKQEWTPKKDRLLMTLTPREAAARLGVTVTAVYARRHILGGTRGAKSLHLMLEQDLAKELEKYRRRNGIGTRVEAVKKLLRIALDGRSNL